MPDGRATAEEAAVEADLVMPAPDSAPGRDRRPPQMLPFTEGLIEAGVGAPSSSPTRVSARESA